MFYHPILNRLANIDLHLLVKPANGQRFEGQTACFCPVCKRENVKCLYEVEVEGAKANVCKQCNAKLKK